MSWIEEDASGDHPAVFQAISLNPEALEAVYALNEAVAFGNSTLDRVVEEAIGTVVSVANRCRYGALIHAGFLRRHSGNLELASQLLFDHTKADLPAKERKMLDFAVRVSLQPASLTEEDIEGLRSVGYNDQDIISIVLLTSLFNFMNRLA